MRRIEQAVANKTRDIIIEQEWYDNMSNFTCIDGKGHKNQKAQKTEALYWYHQQLTSGHFRIQHDVREMDCECCFLCLRCLRLLPFVWKPLDGLIQPKLSFALASLSWRNMNESIHCVSVYARMCDFWSVHITHITHIQRLKYRIKSCRILL